MKTFKNYLLEKGIAVNHFAPDPKAGLAKEAKLPAGVGNARK
tara:strand:+ start:742 stop:867 length:126 start_codon:yes stop_codon:yes gene_type:complete